MKLPNNRAVRALSGVCAAGMLMASAMPVCAANAYGTDIGGTLETSFDKYLVMDKAANVPNASFTYAVTAGAAKSYDVAGRKFEVLAGVDAGKVAQKGVSDGTISVSFAAGDATKEEANAMVKGFDASVQKYAEKSVTLDFSAVKFPEPGVYRYIITESGTNAGITNDADATRVLDVYVQDATEEVANPGDGGGASSTEYDLKMTVAGYVLHSNTDDAPDVAMGDDFGSGGSYGDTKSHGFTNVYDTSDLTFRKEVAGNQASRDKYFEFTLAITDAVPGTKYAVDLAGAEATSGSNAATIAANAGQANPAELVVGADGTVTQKFYLQHGQEIKVQGLSQSTGYAVTENAEDYKSESGKLSGYTDAANGTVASADLKVAYVNTRNGVIPTGVVMTVLPFAAVTLIGGFGAATILMKKRKKED